MTKNYWCYLIVLHRKCRDAACWGILFILKLCREGKGFSTLFGLVAWLGLWNKLTGDRLTREEQTIYWRCIAHAQRRTQRWVTQRVVRIWGLYNILTKKINLWRSDKTKEKEFRLLGTANCGKVNIWEKLIKDESYLVMLLNRFLLVLVFGPIRV